MPTTRDHTCPVRTLISPIRRMGASLESVSGNAIGNPWLKLWDRTSVMIIPIPIERTIVLLMSTSPRFFITFWNNGAEMRLMRTEETIPARIPRSRLSPVARRTTQTMYMENTTTCG